MHIGVLSIFFFIAVHDKTKSLQKELDELHSELERVVYLLKIADPTGEASKKRESVKLDIPKAPVVKKPPVEKAKNIQKQDTNNATTKASKIEESSESEAAVTNATESKPVVYTVTKPQWLGAVETKETKKAPEMPVAVVEPESDGFVDYKDRKEALGDAGGLENAAPGLIIRKRKPVEEKDKVKVTNSETVELSVGVDIAAEDAVALLLKHTRGVQAIDDEEMHNGGEGAAAAADKGNNSKKRAKKAKKVLGPEKPEFLEGEPDYESWVPPEGKY